MQLKTKDITKLLTCFSLLTFSGASYSAFVLTLDDPTTVGIDVVLADDSLPGSLTDSGLVISTFDQIGSPGVLSYSGAVGAFTVNVTTGVSYPLIGPGRLDLNSIDVSGEAGTLMVSLTNTDFTDIFSGYAVNYGGTTDGRVEFEFLIDSLNGEFQGYSLFSKIIDNTGSGSSAFSENYESNVSSSSLYSLSIIAEINHLGGGQITSFDASINPVPVPASIWLFLTGSMVLLSRKRKLS